jgi:protein-L-isoaspartate(D-aspartate) O-methyltransferase
MPDRSHSREKMVDVQIARRGVRDERVLQAMREVPREAFVPADMAEFAYDDTPLPIEAGQTISQPYIVGLMLEAAALGSGDRSLEVGTGSGYAAAVMSRLCREVFTIERHGGLAALARERLARLGYYNVRVLTGDGTKGWPEGAPYDAILAAAGGPSVPPALREQLEMGGRLVMPVGETTSQRLIKIVRRTMTDFTEDNLGDVRFVPLVGEHGWEPRREDRSPGGRE